jgi:serine/threonine protein kinase/tetratricopeptide (TPR) repeat protein
MGAVSALAASRGWTLLRLLGRGGMGDVYEAVREDAGGAPRKVAIKRLALERTLPENARQRFLREARISTTLLHPNIVRVEGVEVSEDECILIMELLSGGTLIRLAAHDPEPPGWVALAVAAQALAALEHAHGRQVLHRDVTPGNLFVCDDGVLKLLDFGIAKRESGTTEKNVVTGEGRLHGTPEFIAPEQARGGRASVLSDLYQLAASLYFFLSGASPHGSGEAAEVLERAAVGVPVPLALRRPDLPPALVSILDRALQTEPERRFPSAQAMRRAVEQARARGAGGDLGAWATQTMARPPASLDGPTRPSAPRPALSQTPTVTNADTPLVDTSLETGSKLDRYTILACIGEGGMGTVFAAYDPELDRKVALKLLHSDATGASDGRRLVREAQAMARVSHPNVVPVYDVGTFGDRVFVAMEFVEGETLGQWLGAAARSWREIVRVFREAGLGLLGAHEAGLVHRDFKPDNVLLGNDGRIRVTDFGLARVAVAEQPSPAEPGPAAAPRGLLSAELTLCGTIIGTPAYMAPEQHRGLLPDVRTDQFNFAASLYRALYGELPYDPAALAAWKGDDPSPVPRDPPAGSAVPRWLGRILARALAARPEGRYPSFSALLEALGRDPGAVLRRRLGWAASLLGVLLTVGVVVRSGRRHDQLCKVGPEQLAGAWDEDVRNAAARSLAQSARPNAAWTWERARAMLDQYAKDWTGMRQDACVATRIRGDQSDEVLTLRTLCLDEARAELRTVARWLAEPDAKVVDRALKVIGGLPAISRCGDVRALREDLALPADPAQRAAFTVEQERLATARALLLAGKPKETTELAGQVLEAARRGKLRAIEGRALYVLGEASYNVGKYDESEQQHRLALAAAIASGDARTFGDSSETLYFITGYFRHHDAEARQYDQFVEAAIERMGGDKKLMAGHLQTKAGMIAEAGDHAAALPLLERALEIRRADPAVSDLNRANTMHDLAVTYLNLGRYREADSHWTAAVALAERAVGERAPDVAPILAGLASLRVKQGRFEEAARLAERAVSLRKPVSTANDLHLADCYLILGQAETGLGDGARAVPLVELAMKASIATEGADASSVADENEDLGRALLAAGRPADAERSFLHSLEIRDQRSAPAERRIGGLVGLARARLLLDRKASALPLLEEAAGLAARPQADPTDVARARSALAHELVRGHRDGPRARRLLTEARRFFAQADNQFELSRIDEDLRALTPIP